MQNGRCRRRRKEEGKKRKNKKEDGNKDVRSRREGENIKGTRAWNPGDDETGALVFYRRRSSGVPSVFPAFFGVNRVFGIPPTFFSVSLAFLWRHFAGVPSVSYFRQCSGVPPIFPTILRFFSGIPSAFTRFFSAFFLPSRCAPVFPRRRSKISIHRRRLFSWPLSS